MKLSVVLALSCLLFQQAALTAPTPYPGNALIVARSELVARSGRGSGAGKGDSDDADDDKDSKESSDDSKDSDDRRTKNLKKHGGVKHSESKNSENVQYTAESQHGRNKIKAAKKGQQIDQSHEVREKDDKGRDEVSKQDDYKDIKKNRPAYEEEKGNPVVADEERKSSTKPRKGEPKEAHVGAASKQESSKCMCL